MFQTPSLFRSTSLATFFLATFLASLAYSATPAGEPVPVKVDVFAQHAGGKVVYYYRVFNNSQQTISKISIGLDGKNDTNPGNDVFELYEIPSGWNPKFGIPSTSSNSPTGWRVSMSTPEAATPDLAALKEDSPHAITWEPLNANTPKLLAGQTLAKMSIAVDKADTHYLTGHAQVSFAEGNPTNLTVPLESLDTTPPDLTVKLNPELLQTSTDKPVAIHASFTLKDDYDRKPKIRLESITANQPLQPEDVSDASFGIDDRYILLHTDRIGDDDRIYTVTYSATDATGNQSLASAIVTVRNNALEPERIIGVETGGSRTRPFVRMPR